MLNLNKSSQFLLPMLRGKFKRASNQLNSFKDLENNWNGYGAKKINNKVIILTKFALKELFNFFKNNIGLLNNRSFHIKVSPQNDSSVLIKFVYNNEFNCWISIKNNLSVCFQPIFYHKHDGKHTIADRHVDLGHSEDVLSEEIKILHLNNFLNKCFFEHKWKD